MTSITWLDSRKIEIWLWPLATTVSRSVQAFPLWLIGTFKKCPNLPLPSQSPAFVAAFSLSWPCKTFFNLIFLLSIMRFLIWNFRSAWREKVFSFFYYLPRWWEVDQIGRDYKFCLKIGLSIRLHLLNTLLGDSMNIIKKISKFSCSAGFVYLYFDNQSKIWFELDQ